MVWLFFGARIWISLSKPTPLSTMLKLDNHCLITGFYGHPKTSNREESWNLLNMLNLDNNTTWFCFRDFNKILIKVRKWGGGGNLRPQWQIIAFQVALETSSLSSIPTRCPKFTWSNYRQGEGFIKEKMDRSVANPKGMDIFSISYFHVLSALRSDHTPSFISINSKNDIPRRKTHLFRYEVS